MQYFACEIISGILGKYYSKSPGLNYKYNLSDATGIRQIAFMTLVNKAYNYEHISLN